MVRALFFIALFSFSWSLFAKPHTLVDQVVYYIDHHPVSMLIKIHHIT